MSRIISRGPRLPRALLDQVGVTDSRDRRNGYAQRGRRAPDRQEQRNGHHRSTNRRSQPHKISTKVFSSDDSISEGDFDEPVPPTKKRKLTAEKPLESILKQAQSSEADSTPNATLEEASDESTTRRHKERASSPNISRRAARAGLEEDDAEITALERRLGSKGKRSKTLADEDLDWLVRGSDSEIDIEFEDSTHQQPGDEAWLAKKRRKTTEQRQVHSRQDGDGAGHLSDDSRNSASIYRLSNHTWVQHEDQHTASTSSFMTNPSEAEDADFEGFGTEDDESQLAAPMPEKAPRENPYIAPLAGNATHVAKYVPPSLRNNPASNDESLLQLRRQIQGQLNRLSDANMLSILHEIESLYQNNARQHVTSTLVHRLVSLIADPATLNDTFHILHAGFATAVFRIVGTDFAAHLLEQTVNTFDQHYATANISTQGKQSLNLLSFLGYLYTFQAVGSTVVFDYVRMLLDELSETNTELLLRIIRTSGQQLRQDDPGSLREIVLQLQRSVAKAGGEVNLSVRTKFMMETINNLKNNRIKTGVLASQLVSEHVTRMRKTLGMLSNRATVSEPLRIGLMDVHDSDKKGKWWLVGASYHDPAKQASSARSGAVNESAASRHDETGYESETPNNPSNLQQLAKRQGMNTDVRRAIFVCMLSASDYKDAYVRLLKLHLKAKQEIEIPRVLLHCAGAESVYNPYYSLIAQKLCGEKRIQKAFRFAFANAVRDIEGGADAEHESYDEQSSSSNWSLSKIVNLAKLYGNLIAHGDLSIAVLKTFDFSLLQSNVKTLGEVLLTTVLLEANRMLAKNSRERTLGDVIQHVFEQAAAAPEMAQGLQFFMHAVVAPADLAGGKAEKKVVKRGCNIAARVLREVAEAAPINVDDDDEYSDEEG